LPRLLLGDSLQDHHEKPSIWAKLKLPSTVAIKHQIRMMRTIDIEIEERRRVEAVRRQMGERLVDRQLK
jgi:hypothetical protein